MAQACRCAGRTSPRRWSSLHSEETLLSRHHSVPSSGCGVSGADAEGSRSGITALPLPVNGACSSTDMTDNNYQWVHGRGIAEINVMNLAALRGYAASVDAD